MPRSHFIARKLRSVVKDDLMRSDLCYTICTKSVTVIHGQPHTFLKKLWERHIFCVMPFKGS